MNKSILIIFCLALGLSAIAQTNNTVQARQKGDLIQRRYAAMERMGGRFPKPGTQKGCIRFLNTQKELDASELKKVEDAINKYDVYKIEFKDAKPKGCAIELARDNKDAGVVIVIVSDDKTSPLLVSPDEHWAVVNIRGLREGLMSDEAVAKFFPSRCRKQLIRAFVLACSGNGSQYMKNFFYNTKTSDFDLYHEFVPMDAVTRCKEFLARIGVTPTQFVTYRKGVSEGWAPAPTNDIQKAIWDEVHTIPSKPIKIEFDPKTDTK